MASESSECDSPGRLWRNGAFARLFSAHAISLLGASLTSIALGLLAHELVGGAVATVMGITLTIRIAVVVFLSPFAGFIADRIGAKPALLAADFSRALIVLGFVLATAVWQIYLLAFLLNLASALFTPVYKACIPNIVSPGQYPRAVSFGAIAYDAANIAGPALAALFIAWVGFRGNFAGNAAAFLISGGLILSVRIMRPPIVAAEVRPARLHGIRAMLSRPGLVRSLFLAAQVAVMSGFVLVATIHYVKNTLELPDIYYALAMAAYGSGSVAGALVYGQAREGRIRFLFRNGFPIAILCALLMVAASNTFPWLFAAWLLAGAGQVIPVIRGNELLALGSDPPERAHIYAAHFSLSHAGWGVTYPLAGWATTFLGFNGAAVFFALIFAGIVLAEFAWFRQRRRLPGA